MEILLYVLLVAAVMVCAGVVWRFVSVRSKGYPVVVRPLPSRDGRHWRHGVLIYSGVCAKFFKLRSIKPDSNLVLTRIGTEVVGRREITARERHFLESDLHVVEVTHRGRNWEIAVDSAGDTALVAWLESGPSARRDRNSAFNHPRPIS